MNAPHEINVDNDPVTQKMMAVLTAQRDDYLAEVYRESMRDEG